SPPTRTIAFTTPGSRRRRAGGRRDRGGGVRRQRGRRRVDRPTRRVLAEDRGVLVGDLGERRARGGRELHLGALREHVDGEGLAVLHLVVGGIAGALLAVDGPRELDLLALVLAERARVAVAPRRALRGRLGS